MKKILRGIAASRGRVHGPIRVVRDKTDRENFQAGEILVTRITDPSLVGLMAKSSAIVCEIGSLTSHPSIVSREMGIPCVVGVKGALEVLKNVQVAEVNGMSGEIIFEVSENRGELIDEHITEFLDAVAPSICQMDFRTFEETVRWDKYEPLAARSWTKKILKLIESCETERLSSLEIGRLFPNPTEARANMIFDIWSSKYSGFGTEASQRIFSWYNEILRALCIEDRFSCVKNIIHNQKKIEEIVGKTQEANPEIARRLGRLVSACYHLGHAMYSDMHPSIVYDNFGPYEIDAGEIVVIKDFGNLRAPELWLASDTLPAGEIQIVCVYKDVKMSIDSASHVTYDGDTIGGLKKFLFLVDGKEYAINDLEQLSVPIEKMAAEIYEQAQALDFESKKKLYFTQKAYSYKHLCSALGQDWQPDQEIFQEVAGRELYKISWPEEKQEQMDLIKKNLDPRIDFRV